MTKRRLVPCLLIATLMLSFPAFAEDDDDDDFFARETRTPADGGAYLTIGFQGMMLDTDRLTAKMAGTDPFRRVTGGLETELHFYGHGAGIFGVSSDFWAAETEGPDNGVDVTLRSWNILLDMGTDLVAGDAGAVSTVVGLGYGQNRMDIDGDFRAVDLSDPDLPSGRGKATLRQEGFVGDISLRADHRQSKYKGKKASFLWVSGVSVGYRFGFFSKWQRGRDQISNVPYVNQDLLYMAFHFGPGIGFYAHGAEEYDESGAPY